MAISRLSAFFVFLAGMQALLARAEVTPRLSSYFGGHQDICVLLLNRVENGGLPEGTDPLSLVPGLGIEIGDASMGRRLQLRFLELMEASRHSQVSPQQVIAGYLKAHGYSGVNGLSQPQLPPGAATAEDLKEIQKIMADTKIEKVIKLRDLSQKKSASGIVDEAGILNAIERIEKGDIVTADKIAALSSLRIRVDGLATRAKKLRSQVDAAGETTQLTWGFLTDHDKAIRKKISEIPHDKKVYISYPTVNARGELVVSVAGFANLEDYQAFYESYKRGNARTLNYKANLKDYVHDYMEYRYLLTRFRNIDHSKVSFSVSGEKTPAELKAIEDNQSAYKVYVKELYLGVPPLDQNVVKHALSGEGVEGVKPEEDPRDLIHPAAPALRRESFLINYAQIPVNMAKTKWQTAVAVTVVPFFLKNIIGFGAALSDSGQSYVEELHGPDLEYWVKRCGETEDKDSLDDCVNRFAAVAQRSINKKIEMKKQKDPNYDGNEEAIELAVLTKHFLASLYGPGKARVQIANSSQIENERRYLGEANYGYVNNQIKELEAKKKLPSKLSVSDIADASSSDSISVANKQASLTPVAPNKANWTAESIRAQVQSVTNDFNQAMADAKSTMASLASDPKRQPELLDYYTKHIQTVTTLALKLETLSELSPPDNLKGQISALDSQMAGNLTDSRDFLIRVLSEAAVRAQIGSLSSTPNKIEGPKLPVGN